MEQKTKKKYSFIQSRQKSLASQRKRRSKRVRASIKKDSKRLRFSIFRSHKYIYAQIIDDLKGSTLASSYGKLSDAATIGEGLAQKAVEKDIKNVAFDRGKYLYHGHVKALAQGARKGGLVF